MKENAMKEERKNKQGERHWRKRGRRTWI